MDLKSSKLNELLKRLDRAEQGTARAMREAAEAKAEAEKAMQETAKAFQQTTVLQSENEEVKQSFIALQWENADFKMSFRALRSVNADLKKSFATLKSKNAEQNKKIDTLEQKHEEVNTTLGTVMRTTVTPIVTAVIYKTMFKLLLRKAETPSYPLSAAHLHIRKHRKSPSRVGLTTVQQMDDFANTWLDVIGDRNDIAHSATGSDVVECLRWMRQTVRVIVAHGFRKIFGCHVGQWHNATWDQKAKRIFNWSDAELDMVLSSVKYVTSDTWDSDAV